ncbi:MAG: hypothetical protein ACE5IK_06095 [Acidobacteriota bacterium]
MSPARRTVGIGAVSGVVLVALAVLVWSSGGREPGSGGQPAPLARSSGTGEARAGGDAGGAPGPHGSADAGDRSSSPAVDFDPAAVPDWFDAHLQFSHARLEAVRGMNGDPLGVRVLSVRPPFRPARLQIQPGDLLVGINGVSLTDPDHFDRAVDIVGWTFLRADNVRVKVHRGDEEFSLVELGAARTDPVDGSRP